MSANKFNSCRYQKVRHIQYSLKLRKLGAERLVLLLLYRSKILEI